jgi:outer membrane immunogenic protein
MPTFFARRISPGAQYWPGLSAAALFMLSSMTGSVVAGEADHASTPWSGPYIGILGAYDWGATSTDDFVLRTGELNNHHSEDRNGYAIGGEIGYNWLATPQILIGIEADASGGRITGTRNDTGDTETTSAVSHDGPIGTVRGRIGYVLGSWLVFGTGGYAFVDDTVDRTIIDSTKNKKLDGETATPDGFVSGWTAGGGIETEITSGLTFKVEYLHMGFDYDREFVYPDAGANSNTNRRNETALGLNTIRAALNFHLN